jgi:hypothetical protein
VKTEEELAGGYPQQVRALQVRGPGLAGDGQGDDVDVPLRHEPHGARIHQRQRRIRPRRLGGAVQGKELGDEVGHGRGVRPTR